VALNIIFNSIIISPWACFTTNFNARILVISLRLSLVSGPCTAAVMTWVDRRTEPGLTEVLYVVYNTRSCKTC
jgi:hypothetical protein